MNNNKGFTLMEVLIASFLVGLVVITTVAISLSSNLFFRSSTNQTGVQNEAAIIMEHMVRHIENGPQQSERVGQGDGAYYVETDTDGSNPYIIIQTTPPYDSDTTEYYIKYYWQKGKTGYGLRYYPESINNTNWLIGFTLLSNLLDRSVPPNDSIKWTIPDPANKTVLIEVTVGNAASGETITLQSSAQPKQRPTYYPWE